MFGRLKDNWLTDWLVNWLTELHNDLTYSVNSRARSPNAVKICSHENMNKGVLPPPFIDIVVYALF